MDRVRTRDHVGSRDLVLVAGVLGDAAEEGEGKRPLDVIMAVHGGRDGSDDPLADTLVLGRMVRRDKGVATREF